MNANRRHKLARPGPDLAASWLLVGVIVAAHLKVLTYVTGQDPFTYVRLALDLLRAGFSWSAWRDIASFIAPGYPGLLAAVIGLFGPWAVAWVNLFFVAGTWLLYYRLLRRWGFEAGPSCGAALAAFGLTLSGSALNAHFLFYPFRGAPQFFFMLAAMYAVAGVLPDDRRTWWRLPAACAGLMIGTVIRETTVFAWPGLVVWLLVAPEWRGFRRRGLVWLCLLPVLAVLGLVSAALLLGADANQQLRTWLFFLRRQEIEVPIERLLMYSELGWQAKGAAGSLLLVLGVWFHWRNLNRILIWVVPALLLAAFYSVFMVHQRYWLDSALLLAMLGGMGVAGVMQALAARVAERRRLGVTLLMTGTALGLTLSVIANLGMWGPRVRASHVRAFQAALAEIGPSDMRIAVDTRDVFLHEALWVFTDYPRVSDMNRDVATANEEGMIYLHPLNRRFWRPPPEPERTEWLLRTADLQAFPDPELPPRRIRLGPLWYEVFRVTPWQSGTRRVDWGNISPVNNLLWLDFRSSDPDAERTITRLDADGRVVASWRLARGNGLIPVVMPEAPAAGERLEITSSSPFPSVLATAPPEATGGRVFPFHEHRLASSLRWLMPPVSRSPTARWGAAFSTEARFAVPFPLGGEDGEFVAVIELAPHPPQDRLGVFEYRADDQVLGIFTNHLMRARFRHRLTTSLPAVSPVWPIQLTVRDLEAGAVDLSFRISAMSFGWQAGPSAAEDEEVHESE
ncbi:MAG TPA: hypothetical protein PKE26_09490 [Kiritimatiellia bacterium]|nr:hypothetical protein [Kiritimatiellia bacterium]HMO99328.1 hypothetical protein [Kiritimatiellia bacterium]HMP96086.1 hypothetical protein [Kiritimatiellia bacterium]